MKTFLILCLICFTLNYGGPTGVGRYSSSGTACNGIIPENPADCVDLNLLVGGKYYDRCCYVRFVLLGSAGRFCANLTEEQYLDIVETKEDLEKQLDEQLLGFVGIESTEGYHAKIYQIECASSYIKFFSIASILLALLFWNRKYDYKI